MKRFKWNVHIVLFLLVALILSGCSATQKGETTKVTDKKISFVKQTKDQGKHIWFRTYSDDIAKNSMVNSIYILNKGKVTEYRIVYPHTLGEISKMNDSDIIKLAKKEDKEYFDVSADEVKNFVNDVKNPRIGIQTDFWENEYVQDVLEGYGSIYDVKDLKKDGLEVNSTNIKLIEPKEYDKFDHYDSYDTKGSTHVSGHINFDSLFAPLSKDDNPYHDEMNKKMLGTALIKNIKTTRYQTPNAQNMTNYKEETDNSGNKILTQSIAYQTVNLFDGHVFDQQAYETYKDNKDMNDYLELMGRSNDLNEQEKVKEKNLAKQLFTDQNLQKTTKKIFGYHKEKKELTMVTSVSQEIYKANYIGYALRSDRNRLDGYLLTKSQVKGQKAVFSK